MNEVHKADDAIRANVNRLKSGGMTQLKLIVLLVLALSIMVCFQNFIFKYSLLYYPLFTVYFMILLICIIYF